MSHNPTLGARWARWALPFCPTHVFTNTNTDYKDSKTYTDKVTITNSTQGASDL